MKTLVLIGLVALTVVGCRAVSNTQEVNLTAGNDIHYHSETAQDGTQAADKEVGDISPNTSISPAP